MNNSSQNLLARASATLLSLLFLLVAGPVKAEVPATSQEKAPAPQQADPLPTRNQAENAKKISGLADKQEGNQASFGAQGAEATLGNAISSQGSAGQAAKDQSAGSGMNTALSGVMAVMGAVHTANAVAAAAVPDPGTAAAEGAQAAFHFLQAALGMMQAGNQGGASGKNSVAANDFNTYGKSGSGGSGTGGTGDSSSANDGPQYGSGGKKALANYGEDPYKNLPPGAKDIMDKMTAHGYKVDLENQTFTTPDGRSITAQEASNGSLVESKLGLPPGTYAKGMETVAEIMKRNGLLPDGGEAPTYAGGGDGDGSAGGEGYDGSGGKGKSDPNKDQKEASRLPASALVAGLSSTYKGERIGVSADDIFNMVTRRYQLKKDQDSFITPDRPQRGSHPGASSKKAKD